ncbi:MAG: class I SAM-dependent methyltransferase [Oryzomonas sp.]|uniref:class I SAM-dependent methyltransferase n=1 Tax=Oryzomonas sp. TaxID=2855186 RepID=UPI0028432407|nr:class I SAM-dependent methyltransferase [Oryzomonas sp.]MDR3581458.1 class I SAM-dependent methyltransferase [Oryzomonas sp.]
MDWYPTPSYLLKRRVILEYLKRYDMKTFLEVGCGCGDLLHVLEGMGYHGLGIDISQDALNIAARGLSSGSVRLHCCSHLEVKEQFDVVIASEVMEHHHDDVVFLSQLRDRLFDGGRLLLTVPAHMKDWGANDDFCGHVRRYERDELESKLNAARFGDIEVYSYGVPVYNIMKPFYDRAIVSKSNQADQMDKTAGSSGMWLLTHGGDVFRFMFNDVTMYPFYLLQRFFYTTNLGKGFFAAARKKG